MYVCCADSLRYDVHDQFTLEHHLLCAAAVGFKAFERHG